MAELDELWAEVHDAERRIGVLEQAAAVAASQREWRRWFVPILLSVLGTAALVFATFIAAHVI